LLERSTHLWHVRCHLPSQKHGALDIDLQYLVNGAVWHLQYRPRCRVDRRVADEDVDARAVCILGDLQSVGAA